MLLFFLDPKNRSMFFFFFGGGVGFQHVFFTFKSKETWFDNDSPQGEYHRLRPPWCQGLSQRTREITTLRVGDSEFLGQEFVDHLNILVINRWHHTIYIRVLYGFIISYPPSQKKKTHIYQFSAPPQLYKFFSPPMRSISLPRSTQWTKPLTRRSSTAPGDTRRRSPNGGQTCHKDCQLNHWDFSEKNNFTYSEVASRKEQGT